MSVWATSIQKLDIARALYETLGPAVDKVLGDEVYPYLQPKGTITPIRKDDTWEDVAAICRWKEPKELEDDETGFLEFMESSKRWYVGIEAVYQVVHSIHAGRFTGKDAYNWEKIEAAAAQIGLLVAPSTQITPKKFIELWGTNTPTYIDLAKRYESMAEAWKHSRLQFTSKPTSVEPLNQKRFFGEGRRVYYGWIVGNLLFLRGAKEYVNRSLVLTRAHIDILVECLSRLANTYHYLATQYADKPVFAGLVSKMVDLQINTAARARRENANYVVKAFHKARALAQMKLQHNEHEGAIADAAREYIEDGLNQVLDIAQYDAIVESVPEADRTDLLHTYKWMPPPDFDATYSFADLHGWHTNPRPSGADPDATSDSVKLWESVKRERKMNLAAAYRHLTGQWPEELGCGPKGPSLAQCDAWEPRALFAYYQYGTDIVGQIKDKATVSASFDKEFEKRSSEPSESFLLWYLENAGKVDTREDLALLAEGNLPEDNYVRVAYKSEGHKPGSRLFHIAPPRRRILLGEFEGNLSRIASGYPGSLQGKTTADKDRIVSSIMDLYADPPGVDGDVDYELFVITFDLSKFSPKSNYAITEDYHKFWAQVYDKPELEALKEIGCKSKILHTTAGLRMSYQNTGADLEGFRGRMQTMFHSDMLAASCRLAKEEGYLVGKGVLGTFIDDGAVKVAVRGMDEEARVSVNGFLNCMQRVYAACGQENHPNKTQISRTGGELLADQYFRGVKLPTPIKAAQRLAPDYENAAACITEEFDSLFAASQGCVKDGGDWIQTYKRYVISMLKSIFRWSRQTFTLVASDVMALKVMTPKSYGGFGLQPLQCLVTTAGANLTVEGMGLLNRAARMYPTYRPLIKRVVTKGVVKRDPLSILRDPTRIRANGPAIVENRLMMRVVRWLEERENTQTGFLRAYKDIDLKAHATAVAEAILSKHSLSVPVLERAWKVTPLAYVESVVGKFRRSSTIIRLIGHKEVLTIRKKNVKDVETCLLEYL